MKRTAPTPSAQELWHAVARDEYALVRYLLEQGADPNAVGLKPHPLVMCARRNALAMLRLLLEAKADPDGGASASDFVPLSVCETREAASMVIAAGANLNQENAMGHTPLHVIAAQGDSVASITVLQTVRYSIRSSGYRRDSFASRNNL